MMEEGSSVPSQPSPAAAAAESAGTAAATIRHESTEPDSDDDDESFKSAASCCSMHSAQSMHSASLTESLMECSSSMLFRSAHSTLDAFGPASSLMSGSGTVMGNNMTSGGGESSTTPAEPPTIRRVSRPTTTEAAAAASSPSNSHVVSSKPGAGQSTANTANSAKQKSDTSAAADAAGDADYKDAGGPWRLITHRTEVERPRINSVVINQDVTCIAVGTSRGFRIRTVVPSPPPPGNDNLPSNDNDRVMVHQTTTPHGGASVVQMLYGTSLLALVRTASPRILTMTNAWTGISLRDLHFVAPVKRVEMNRRVLAVLTAEGRLHVFDLATLNVIKSVGVLHPEEPLRSITGSDAASCGAFFALSSGDSPAVRCNDGREEERGEARRNCWLACRSPDRQGDVRVYDATTMSLVGTVKAHSHPIARIAIGGGGSGSDGGGGEQRMATASRKGTVIRIWALPSCAKLYVLLRGSNPCDTYSLSFNGTGTRLGSYSSSGTVHIFKLSKLSSTLGGQHSGGEQMVPGGLASRLSSVPRGLSFFLPESVVDQTDGLRSYARIRMRSSDGGAVVGGSTASAVPTNNRAVVAFLKPSNRFEDDVLVCTERGGLYRFVVDARGRSRTVAVEDVLFDDEHVVYNSL